MAMRHLQLPLASTSSSLWGSIANARQQAEGLGIRVPEKFVGYGGVRGSSSSVGIRDSGKSYRGGGRGSSRGGYGRGGSSSSRGGRGYRREDGDSRGYRGGRGSGRGGGGGGRRGGRYDALRRAAEERMHRGAYKMVDEETGEDVVVWGVEEEELPQPTSEDLKWKPAAMVAAGDVSEEGWYKAMEASMAGPSGAFSVRGVRQGGMYADEEEEEDPDYDDEDDMYESDNDEEEEDDLLDDDHSDNSLEEPQDERPVRPARVKLFGRDFKQNDFLKVEASREVNATQHSAIDSRSDLFLDGNTSDVGNLEVGPNMMSSSVVEKESIHPNSVDAVDYLMSGTPPKDTPHQTASFSYKGVGIKSAEDQKITSKSDNVGSPTIEEAADQPWPPVGALLSGSTDGLFSIESIESEKESSPESNSAVQEDEKVSMESRSWPPQGMFSGGVSESQGKSTALGETARIPGVGEFSLSVRNAGQKSNNSAKDDAHVSNRSNQHLEDGGTNLSVIDRDDDDGDTMKKQRMPAATRNVQHTTRSGVMVEEREERSREAWQQGGGMNPGIIEIDEDGEFGTERVQDRRSHEAALESTPVRSNLLDELRMQTQRKQRTKVEEDDKVMKVGDSNQESGSRRSLDSVNGNKPEGDSSGVTVVRPQGFRDLKARTNFDPSLAAEFFSQKSFANVGASEEIIRALAFLQVKKPSAIQAMAFKPVMEGRSCIVADQTGSGKTLAYVAPLVQMLRVEEAKSDVKSLSKKPRVLVLVPTSELAVQVHGVCRAFSKGGAPFRSIVLTGGFKWKTQAESLAQGADVVIATPGRFLQHLEKGSLKLDMLKSVVLDEVDILLDDQEFAEVLQVVDEAASKRVQYVHVTATLPVDIHDSLLTRYPDAIPLMGPTLHQTAVGLQEILVDCSGAEGEEKTPEAAFTSKKSALLQLVDQRPVSKTIIFCNKIEICRRVENVLARYDRSGTKLTVLPYHAALSQEARLESMQQFLEAKPNKSLFLVCTDRASRGLDSFDVEHVVLFDYPRDPSEYVRRVGRTARGAGGTGKVFVFALGKQVAMARRIMARNEKGRPIHDVPGSEYEM